MTKNGQLLVMLSAKVVEGRPKGALSFIMREASIGNTRLLAELHCARQRIEFEKIQGYSLHFVPLAMIDMG